MTALMGSRKFTPSDRFFKLSEYICIYLDMEIYAITASQNLPVRQPGNYFATLGSKQFPIDVRHPVFGPFWGAFDPRPVDYYELTFVAKQDRQAERSLSSDKWGDVAEMVWNMLLVYFYEQHRPWIQSEFGATRNAMDSWPSLLRFAWALRNAAAHHHGRINITDPSVPPVVWHHLRYDHADAGLKVFGDVLTIADLLIFLVEMSDELDRLGCPRF